MLTVKWVYGSHLPIHLNVQAAAFIPDFVSEFSYDGDADVTSSRLASRREGVEVQSLCLALELNTDLSFARRAISSVGSG